MKINYDLYLNYQKYVNLERHEDLLEAVEYLLEDIRCRYRMNNEEEFYCPHLQRLDKLVKEQCL